MRIPEEMFEEAKEWAKHELEDRSADDQWALLHDLMQRERDVQIERMIAMLRLEALRALVAPHTKQAAWNKGLDPKTDLDRWVHEQRLRNATM
jgi:hypothetical protein